MHSGPRHPAAALSGGKGRAREAAIRAISSPLLEVGIEKATGVVWNITGPPNMSLFEVSGAQRFSRPGTAARGVGRRESRSSLCVREGVLPPSASYLCL